MLSGNSDSQTAVATSLGSDKYNDANGQLGERLVQQTSQCVSMLTPDYTKITDINVRKALAYAYPYEDVWIAGGEVPGVTRVPANSLMPPGMAGKKEFQVDGEQITYDPEKSKELLAEAGYGDEPYPITMVYYEVDPLAKAAQDQITKGFEAGGFSVKAIPSQESLYNIWLDPDNKVNKRLNFRGVNWCSDWPAGSTILPSLARTGAVYNTAYFSEPVDRRGDGPHQHAAARRAGRRVGGGGREDHDGVLPDHPDRVPQRPLRLRREDRQPDGRRLDRRAELQGPVRHAVIPA